MDHRTPIKLKGHCSDPVPMALLKGPIKYMDRKAPFDEYVNDAISGWHTNGCRKYYKKFGSE